VGGKVNVEKNVLASILESCQKEGTPCSERGRVLENPRERGRKKGKAVEVIWGKTNFIVERARKTRREEAQSREGWEGGTEGKIRLGRVLGDVSLTQRGSELKGCGKGGERHKRRGQQRETGIGGRRSHSSGLGSRYFCEERERRRVWRVKWGKKKRKVILLVTWREEHLPCAADFYRWWGKRKSTGKGGGGG